MDEQWNQEIAQLYVAMFGRAPDAEGLGFWVGLREQGQTMVQVADAMFGTSPARAYFPEGTSNEGIIESFYLNVLGREADAEGLGYWTAKLNLPGATPGSTIAEMIDVIANYAGADPGGMASADLFNGRVAAAQFFGEYVASGDAPPFRFGQIGSSFGPELVVATGASGVIDATGYGSISIGELGGHITIANMSQGATLVVRDQPSRVVWTGYDYRTEWSINCMLASPDGADDTLRIELDSPEALWLGPLHIHGVEYLNIVSLREPHAGWNAESLHFDYFSTFRQVTVSGIAEVEIKGLYADVVDATGLQKALYSSGGNSEFVLGGTRGDVIALQGDGTCGYGGAGDDVIVMLSGSVLGYGGAGSDTFRPLGGDSWLTFTTVGDFTPGEDKIHLWDLVGTATMEATIWNSSALVVPAGLGFTECLDIAASVREAGISSSVSWFQFSGDTFLVVDNDQADGFVGGVDHLVKLSGLVDLSAMRLGWSEDSSPFVLS